MGLGDMTHERGIYEMTRVLKAKDIKYIKTRRRRQGGKDERSSLHHQISTSILIPSVHHLVVATDSFKL